VLTVRVMGEIWVRPATCIVTFCLVFAYVAGLGVGYYSLPPVFGYTKMFACLLTLIVGLYVFWHVIALRGTANPTRTLIQKFQPNRDLAWSAGIGLSLAMLQFAALTWAKPTVPMVAGFWADPLLARADAALFGTDPWRLLHAIFGPRNLLIDTIYSMWFPVVLGVLFFTFISRSPIKSRLIVAYFLTIAIGILIQFALPSGGPIFYGRLGFENRFAELTAAIPPSAMKGSGYLWGCHLGFRECMAGWGISAWPSMHVALATWAVVAVAALRRSLFPIAIGWWAMIFIGSIYLGWHYVLDGVAGALIVAMAWAIQGRAIPVAASDFGLARG
jgi:hypothetical protein